MNQPRRIIGFMPSAARYIQDHPGLTAQEIVRKVIQATRTPLSAASNPQESLVATLHQNHQSYDIVRSMGQDRRYRFYPRNTTSSGNHPPTTGAPTPPRVEEPTDQEGCCIQLSQEDRQAIDALVVLGVYRDIHQAHQGLLGLGMEQVINDAQAQATPQAPPHRSKDTPATSL